MPKLGEGMATHKLADHFGFSAAKVDTLGATEYTLVTVALDASGSVAGFQGEMEKCVQEIVKACKLSPRADNLMVRLLKFNDNLKEVHGFRPLSQCPLTDYDGFMQSGGGTALFDGAYNAAEATAIYGKQLIDNDYSANGLLVVVTDGCDNSSKMTPAKVKESLAKTTKAEYLESLVSLLIGVDVAQQGIKDILDKFHKDVGFTEFIALADAKASTIAKIGRFISHSISQQSKSLGTGSASKPLDFLTI